MTALPNPYREPASPVRHQPDVRTLAARLRQWWTGDDGRVYVVVGEPSVYRTEHSVLLGPFSRRQARRAARQYVRENPYGEATISRLPIGATWPPRCNRRPFNYAPENWPHAEEG